MAIVDRGRVVAQGRIDEIAAGADATVLVGVEDEAGAPRALQLHGAIAASRRAEEGGLRLTLHRDVEVELAVADINRRLVEAGVPSTASRPSASRSSSGSCRSRAASRRPHEHRHRHPVAARRGRAPSSRRCGSSGPSS